MRGQKQWCKLPREYWEHQLLTLSPGQPKKVLCILLSPRPAWEMQYCSTARPNPVQPLTPHCYREQTTPSVSSSQAQLNLLFLNVTACLGVFLHNLPWLGLCKKCL